MSLPRKEKAFEEQKKRAKARMPAVSEAAIRHANAIVEANLALLQQLSKYASLGRVVQDVKAARDRLVFPGFLSRTPMRVENPDEVVYELATSITLVDPTTLEIKLIQRDG